MTDLRRLALEFGLTSDELDLAIGETGRELTLAEVAVLSAMWSEHCSYKSSRVHLRKFPTEGPRVVIGPGENAGVIDIGGGHVAVFKMESHNHPSYIEPYQGAATGVGGILRDVFTMGARPIASLNSLRFGSPDHERTRYLLRGVVAGIAGYGNCIGVPTVGGEIQFDSSYDGNCLVNVFNLGVARREEIFLGTAAGVGNPVLYVGAKTGRDGIHGASMASQEFSGEADDKRPTVQVGDPFEEKLLLEACLELMHRDDCPIVGIQDMGAAGLTSSSVEMASRAGTGLRIDATRVPTREPDMAPWEILLSESQERMLIVCQQGRQHKIAEVFAKWDLDCAEIGEVTNTRRLEVVGEDGTAVDLSIALLTDAAPCYERPTRRPAYMARLDTTAAEVPSPAALGLSLTEVARQLLASPNLCSRQWVWEQFDHMVGLGTVVRPGADAAVVRVPETGHGLAITVDVSGRYCYLDPRLGAQLALAECARNLICVGATPAAVTDCLNFGNPENPEIMWQFVEAVEGLAEGCRELGTPVVSGNVSLYNETDGRAILPTPTVAMVGVFPDGLTVDDTPQWAELATLTDGHELVLLGTTRPDDFGGSEYITAVACEPERGAWAPRPPALDWSEERALSAVVRRLIALGVTRCCHDLSEGGLLVALAEMAHATRIGISLDVNAGDLDMEPWQWLLAESPSRAIVACPAAKVDEVLAEAHARNVPARRLGRATGDCLQWDGHLSLTLHEITHQRGWLDRFAV